MLPFVRNTPIAHAKLIPFARKSSRTSSRAHKCVPFIGKAHHFAYRSAENGPLGRSSSISGALVRRPSGLEENATFANSYEFSYGSGHMLEVVPRRRGVGER